MTTNQPTSVLEEIKDLIANSMNNYSTGYPDLSKMHKKIIKKYFEARNIVIDYSKQTVKMEIPVGKNQYTSLTFECQELQRFLESCLKTDEGSIDFYQDLLNRYKVTSAA